MPKAPPNHPVRKLQRPATPPVQSPDIYIGGNEKSPEENKTGAADQYKQDQQKINNPLQFQPPLLARRTKVT